MKKIVMEFDPKFTFYNLGILCLILFLFAVNAFFPIGLVILDSAFRILLLTFGLLIILNIYASLKLLKLVKEVINEREV